MDRENNTISFYLPVLPQGFEWDINLNEIYGPSPQDFNLLAGRDVLEDGKTYTFNYHYNAIKEGYFYWGTAKKGLVRADYTGFDLKTGKKEYHDYGY